MYDDAEAHQKKLDRERMAEIRPRGKRGKLKKPRKPPRLSEARMKRSDKAVADILALTKLKVGKVSQKKTRRILQELVVGDSIDDLSPAMLWKKVKAFPNKFSVRQHKRGYAMALRHVLAVLEYISDAGIGAEVDVRVIAEITNLALGTKGFDIIWAVLFLVIDYTEDDGSIDRKDISRDAAAIRYLLSQKVRSYTLEKWMKTNPGGVHKWSTLASKYAFSAADDRKEAESSATKSDAIQIQGDYYDDVQPHTGEFSWGDVCTKPQSCMCKTVTENFRLESGDSCWVLFRVPIGGSNAEIDRALRLSHRGAPGKRG